MDSSPPEFLKNVLASYTNSAPPPTRPHVTLTFAQSLDAKIAGAGGRQLILSGKESTAINDDPQLNVRHLPQPSSTPYHLPRPVIIDTHLRLPPTCKLLRNFQNGVGRRPWVVCSTDETASADPGIGSDFVEARLQRKQALERAGARVIETTSIPSSDGKFSQVSIPMTLRALRGLGICSLMVEGGAHIIASFMEENVVDSLIITIAPVLVGNAGISYQYPITPLDGGKKGRSFKELQTVLFGRDSVVTLVSEPVP